MEDPVVNENFDEQDYKDKFIENINMDNNIKLQELTERARISQENFEREEKARKELEAIHAVVLKEKNDLQRQLEGEKGSLTEYQERAIKLAAQKMDLESQLLVSFLKI